MGSKIARNFLYFEHDGLILKNRKSLKYYNLSDGDVLIAVTSEQQMFKQKIVDSHDSSEVLIHSSLLQ